MIAHGFWFGPGWGIVAGLLSVAFWILVAMVIVSLVRGRPAGGGRTTAALRILEERYARGEITREEFLERRDVLSGEPSSPTTPPER